MSTRASMRARWLSRRPCNRRGDRVRCRRRLGEVDVHEHVLGPADFQEPRDDTRPMLLGDFPAHRLAGGVALAEGDRGIARGRSPPWRRRSFPNRSRPRRRWAQRLTPERTRSGSRASPSWPPIVGMIWRTASMTQSVGVPRTPKRRGPARRSRSGTWSVSECEAPDCSASGATIHTSSESAVAIRCRVWNPGAWIPSSLVKRMRSRRSLRRAINVSDESAMRT